MNNLEMYVAWDIFLDFNVILIVFYSRIPIVDSLKIITFVN